MKLNLIKISHQYPVANGWLDVCRILKDGELPCLNFTRDQFRQFFNDKKRLIDEVYGDDVQVTSRGTDIIDFFEIDDILSGGIPIRECTDKELRKAHNIRKMYISGAFDYCEDEDLNNE